jgi:flagellar biosynthesis protein
MTAPQKPTTAVALRWDGAGAPKVTAKGRHEVADRILELAGDHEVPVREDPELTELLARVELGEEIPTELYLAVAQVIAFAYRLSGKRLPAEEPTP